MGRVDKTVGYRRVNFLDSFPNKNSEILEISEFYFNNLLAPTLHKDSETHQNIRG